MPVNKEEATFAPEVSWQPIGGGARAAVSTEHRFGVDAFLLAHFAAPRRGERVCELGTGCGIVALRLCLTGQPRSVHGVDVAPEAVALAQQSAAAFSGSPRPTFALGDWENPAAIAPAGSCRLVVCNPPYFAPGAGGQSLSPAACLARHERPGTLAAVARAAAWLLPPGGRFCLCHRPERLPALLSALTENGLEPKRLQPVQQRADTSPWLILVEARRGGRPGLSFLPPFLLQGEDGSPTPAAEELYK